MTQWRLDGEEIGSCNCAWGCPCQFNALPTHGRCEALIGYIIRDGHFGGVSLSGIVFALIASWPGALHEGNGSRRYILDERMTAAQREAVAELCSGKHGGAFFEIFAAICSKTLDPLIAPVTVELDREKRQGIVRIPGIAESRIEPIRNPVTGEEHRARIELPNGFEYRVAEMGNSVEWAVSGAGPELQMRHENTYAQLNEFHWSSS
jgi:hypothetical protein